MFKTSIETDTRSIFKTSLNLNLYVPGRESPTIQETCVLYDSPLRKKPIEKVLQNKVASANKISGTWYFDGRSFALDVG